MKNINLLACLLLISSTAIGQKQLPSNYQPGTYMPGRVIFKLLPETRPALAMEEGQPKTYRLADAAPQKICAAQGSYSVKALYPQHWGRAAGKVDLSLIGELEFAETANVPALCRQLMATGQFEYVEPRLIYKTAGDPPANWTDILPSLALPFTPNDPMVAQQWHLGKIKAFDAWDIEQGDTSVLIAIVDTGVDYNHPDLAANIAVNHADPVNGLDDDGNGKIDDYLGWDFYYEDNDPKPGASHGTAVAGIAAAVTNNGIGLAAPGFNSRILSVKASSDTPGDLNIPYGFEGIVYAADRGCRVINCSWGGPGSSNKYMDDIIRYATFDKNALVISVSHNQNTDTPNYPASAEFVVSVAATNVSDVKESYSNFNHFVDISAPSTIWSTLSGGTTYTNGWWGTSFAAPLVSGAAAILAAHDPSLTALQLGERLQVTADNIDAQNPNYVEQLGRGRLNMYRALTDAPSPAVRFTDAFFTDGNDDVFTLGDTLRLSGTFINYLADATDLTVTSSTPNPDFIFLDNSFSIGSLGNLSEVDNENEPFLFVVGANIPPDTELPIRMHFQAVGYDDWQWLIINTNQTSIDINNGVIATTITSEGRIGINNALAGLGFQYLPSDQVFAVYGLMLGNSSSRVSDAALNNWNLANPLSSDFKIVEPVRPATLPLADIELNCAFNDSTTIPATAIMGLSVRQNTYAWLGDHFIIAEYEVTNNSTIEYNTFHVGLWGEIEIMPNEKNRGEQDSALRLGYVYNTTQPSPYVGIQLLGQSPFNLYVFEYSTTYGGVNITDNFSTSEKYKTLTESRPSGGFGNADGADVGLVVSSGPYQLAPGGTVKVAFAILAADSLEGLLSAAEAANLRYDGIFVSKENTRAEPAQPLIIFPNPATDFLNFQLPEASAGLPDVQVFDAQGRLVLLANGPRLDVQGLAAGLYSLKVVVGERVFVGRFVKI